MTRRTRLELDTRRRALEDGVTALDRLDTMRRSKDQREAIRECIRTLQDLCPFPVAKNERSQESTWCRPDSGGCGATFVVRGFPPNGRSGFKHCPFCGATSEAFA